MRAFIFARTHHAERARHGHGLRPPGEGRGRRVGQGLRATSVFGEAQRLTLPRERGTPRRPKMTERKEEGDDEVVRGGLVASFSSFFVFFVVVVV